MPSFSRERDFLRFKTITYQHFKMNKYNRINNITGWVIFLIASAVYILTIEPTASFWDCGEFIATSLKLQVGHPPGAPFFMMVGRLFTILAGNDVTKIPVMVNTMSALASGFTILFLFWTITHLAKKIVGQDKAEYSLGEYVAIIGSGVVGALAYTFSDTFWFSAVEGEVYASSSFFTAIVFWAILKWENVANEKYANRWLILIAYLMGLSIGVHLLNLLAIPAIVLIYYFKKYNVTRWGTFVALMISFLILGGIMYVIIPGIFEVASWFELLFVNQWGLAFNTGFITFLVLMFALLVFGLYYTYQKQQVLWNTIILVVTVIIIGYSSYGMIVIRSMANTPLNENNPSNIFNLLSYLNREQYGDRPLVSGPYFNAPLEHDPTDGKPTYAIKGNKYVVVTHKPEYEYNSSFVSIFPRMYSRENSHINAYLHWADIKEGDVFYPVLDKNGQPVVNQMGEVQYDRRKPKQAPTFGENLKFFFRYQVGFMYWRYFMWNFSGRQNDIQGEGGPLRGNWITGIKFIDELLVGPQDGLPKNLKNNWGRNKYYMLPFILGLIGLMYQFSRNKKDFSVIMLLFFMTGLAIVIYLNQTPYQPRERDYAYAGSFYAYAIWIGLGVIALIDLFPRFLSHGPRAILISVLSLGLVPGIMAKENWDDHDRSGRFTAHDFAYNYLNSCDKNAVLFTNGDNDTFPLWYIQEVENVRTDVRVVNLSYLGADWYIEQMQRKVYQSDPLPFSMNRDKYITGTRDIVYVLDQVGDYFPLKDAVYWLASDEDKTKHLNNYAERIEYLPANKLIIPVDSALVLSNGTVSKYQANKIVKDVRFELRQEHLYKNDMMVLDLLANFNWKRPVYFAITVSDDNYLNMQDYFRLDGLAYRVVPILSKRNDGQIGSVDTQILYDNLINKFKWGGVNNPKVYLDENNLRMLSNFRNNFSRLAEELINEGKKDSAVKVLDKCMEIMPESRVPYNYFIVPIAEQYYRTSQKAKADKIVEAMYANTVTELNYYFKFKGGDAHSVDYEKRVAMQMLSILSQMTETNNKVLHDKIEASLMQYYNSFMPQNQNQGGLQPVD